MRVAKRGGGYRDMDAKVDKAVNMVNLEGRANLVSLSGAPGGVELLTSDETEANKVHLKIVELKRRYQETQFELAALLWRVNEERLFTAKSLGGYGSFGEYVESELEFSIRKAHMLITMHWWYSIEQHGDQKLLQGAREIGWTKAYHLVKVIDPTNADQWLMLAKKSTERSLAQQVRAALNAAGKTKGRRVRATKPTMNPLPGMNPDDPEPETPTTEEAEARGFVVQDLSDKPDASEGVPPPSEEQVSEVMAQDEKWTTWSARIPKESKGVVDEAIELAKKLAKTQNSGWALSLMAQHFLSFSHDKKTVMIGEWLATFERNTGLKVIAVDPQDEQVVYGQELLKSVEEEEK